MGRGPEWPPDDLIRDVIALQRAVTQLQIHAKGSEWYDYALTWASDGTAPALGDSVVVSRYQRIGRTAHVLADITLGASATIGTGLYTFSLPFISTYTTVGVARFFDSTTTARYGGQCIATAGTDVMSVWLPTSGSAHLLSQLSATVPVAPAVSDNIRMRLTYEVTEGL